MAPRTGDGQMMFQLKKISRDKKGTGENDKKKKEKKKEHSWLQYLLKKQNKKDCKKEAKKEKRIPRKKSKCFIFKTNDLNSFVDVRYLQHFMCTLTECYEVMDFFRNVQAVRY